MSHSMSPAVKMYIIIDYSCLHLHVFIVKFSHNMRTYLSVGMCNDVVTTAAELASPPPLRSSFLTTALVFRQPFNWHCFMSGRAGEITGR